MIVGRPQIEDYATSSVAPRGAPALDSGDFSIEQS